MKLKTINPSADPELFAPEETGGISLEDVFTAYFDCRRSKRRSSGAVEFEADYERRLVDLWRRINAGVYRPDRSVAFIVTKPVCREVFAPSFESRVVDHLLARRLEPILERHFIDDNYATRKGKGTLYGIRRFSSALDRLWAETNGDCHVMKLDLKSYFMSIDKAAVCRQMSLLLETEYEGRDKHLLISLLQAILTDRPELHCDLHSPRKEWRRLPRSKSLFGSDGRHGLPIGRLLSQLAASLTLDELDHLITEDWGIACYGRYVDDMVLAHADRDHLKHVRRRIDDWARLHGLQLHPRKMYLQHAGKGVMFVGGMIRPGRVYVSSRSVGFGIDAIESWNRKASARGGDFCRRHASDFVATLNSYLGLLGQHAGRNRQLKLLRHVAEPWWLEMYVRRRGRSTKGVLRKRQRLYRGKEVGVS